jgi:CubicO group peptidase (beta-lactamase class C family)
LGHALALSQGTSYEEAQRDRIWSPLGMTRTGISLTPWMTAHLAIGHDEQGNVVSNWDIPTLAGAGAIRSTATDMLAFLAANLHTGRGPLGPAMAFAHQERAEAGGANVKIGLNWMIQDVGVDTIVWHNGGTGGYRSFAGFVPSRKVGVVVLTNSGGAGADDIGMHLLSPHLPLAPRPQPPTQRTAINLTPEQLAPFVGVYQLAPEFAITVTLKDGALFGQATGQGAFQLWPEAASEFFIREVDAQVSFVRSDQGVVTSMVLHQGGQNIPGTKVK